VTESSHKIIVKLNLQALDSDKESWKSLEEFESVENVQIKELIQ